MPFAIPAIENAAPTGYLPSMRDTPSVDAPGFADALTGAVDNLQSMKAASNELSVAAVTGNLEDIHQATLASTRAAVTLELVAAVRNKGVNAFNEIMRMQA